MGDNVTMISQIGDRPKVAEDKESVNNFNFDSSFDVPFSNNKRKRIRKYSSVDKIITKNDFFSYSNENILKP